MTMNNEENNENLLADQLEPQNPDSPVTEEETLEEAVLDDAPEIPKDYSKLKKYLLIGLAAVVLIGAGTFGYMKYDAYSKSYALTFEGKQYSIEEIKLYLLFQNGDPKAAENAVTALTDSLIINKAAKEQGIEMTENEKFAVTDHAKSLKDTIVGQGMTMPGITDERLNDIIAAQTNFTKMMQKRTAEFKIDPATYDKDFKDYLANNKQDYMNVQMKYILTNTAEDAEKARTALAGGMAVDKAIKTYSIDYNPAEGARVVDLKALGLPAEIANEVFNTEIKQYTKALNLNGVFGVFIVEDKSSPAKAQVEEAFKAQYTQSKVFELMQKDLETWRKAASIKVNQKAIDALAAAQPVEEKK